MNSKPMDTHNDGTELTNKTVLPLYPLSQTSPWTWHGWQTSLSDAMNKSFTSTMQGRAIGEDERAAILKYLDSLTPGPNPFLKSDGGLSESALREGNLRRENGSLCRLPQRPLFHGREGT